MLMREIQMHSDLFNTTQEHGIGEKQGKKLYYYFFFINLKKILHKNFISNLLSATKN